MTLQDYQREFNGLVVGDGTAYNLIEESGLEGFDVRSGSRPIPRDDGSIPGLHVVDSKTVYIPLEIVGDPETDITPAVNAALEAFAPSRETEGQYKFKNPGDPERFVWARPLRFGRMRTLNGAAGVDGFQVLLELADPRIYSTELHLETIPEFGASGGGFDFPIVNFPINMTAATQQTAVAVNSGSRDAYPRFVFQYDTGTVSGVQVTNVDNGDVLDINTTLVAGQQLVADMTAAKTAHDSNGVVGTSVISIGGSSRYGDWQHPRDPFRLSPGSNTLQLETAGGGTVVASMTWRDTD